MQTSRIFKTIELFAGGGGMALGFEKAGFTPLLLVEKDKDACATLKTNRPDWPVCNEDVAKVNYAGFNPDVVTGGWPCQAFSHVGKGLGFNDVRGTLFYEFARCVKETKPSVFVGENVYGLLTHDKGRTFEVVLSVLSSLGYSVEYKLVNSADYNVPQKRQRLIIIGVNKSLDSGFRWPNVIRPIPTLKDALKDCPLSAGMEYSSRKAKVMNLVPPGGNWKNLPVDIAKEYMGKSYYNEGGRTTYAKRLAWDEPCLTILCSPAQMQTERCHPDETRPLTIRESARIQTFPDDWKFEGSITSQYKQIGNAVPVNLAMNIANSVKMTIEGITPREETLFGFCL
jgi:DNA (cytosine-5)-methyltransferase 1